MTDRHCGYIVILEEDTRSDDAEETLKAIGMIKGVLDVKPIVRTTDLAIATARVRQELLQKVWDIIKETS